MLRKGNARYLSNDLTRFTSVDTAASSFDPEDPQSWNRYAYTQNDPVGFVDPNGEERYSSQWWNYQTNTVRPSSETGYGTGSLQDAATITALIIITAGTAWETYTDIVTLPLLADRLRRSTQTIQQEGAAAPRATEAYNRAKHYGKTPTAADRKALGTKSGEVANHEPPLVKRYYEGDPKTGEKPGMHMNQAERRASANDRSRMNNQPQKDSQKQGGHMSNYSKEKKKEINKQ